ncbi:MAG: hypothetical protein Q7J35_11755 [Candidatus Methanoperedens sp.]|nr:hypothetical protein [Candidatus Methanoperedens sp.]
MNLWYVDEPEKNNELVRTKTNSGGVSSSSSLCSLLFFSYQYKEGTEQYRFSLCTLCSLWFFKPKDTFICG